MSKLHHAIRDIHRIDTLAGRRNPVNGLHPLCKLVVTVGYIVTVVSFPKYDVIGLLGMAVYPMALFILAELSVWESFRKMRLVLPLVCLVGILNPFLDKTVVMIGNAAVNGGILSMLTLILKGLFCVLASYLLIATTTIEKLCYAFRMLHLPKVMVTQLMLTYRYVTLLLEEAERMTQAYALRAPGQRGIHFKAWGSFIGQLLLRSMDRANDVYDSMQLRGYAGDYLYLREKISIRGRDMGYLIFWLGVFAVFRAFPVILLLGSLIGGNEG